MTDLFALLGESPRPWLDLDQLKAKYHGLTAREHPDAAGATADFAEINRAFQVLSGPATRLRHLLDLESHVALSRAQPVPGDITPFFTPVAGATQSFDAFLKKHAAASSPLARALLSTEQCRLQERIEQTLASLQQKQDAVLAQLREADALWQTDRPAALAALPALWQSLGYTTKWIATLREALFRLASL
jgi:curved DNA-binding protein CbpA